MEGQGRSVSGAPFSRQGDNEDVVDRFATPVFLRKMHR